VPSLTVINFLLNQYLKKKATNLIIGQSCTTPYFRVLHFAAHKEKWDQPEWDMQRSHSATTSSGKENSATQNPGNHQRMYSKATRVLEPA